MRVMPYFMTNKEWYYLDKETHECKLTEKAPPEAVKSYEEFNKKHYNEKGYLKK